MDDPDTLTTGTSTPAEDSAAGSGVDVEESPAQRQARLRRERRKAKIQSGGSARLKKITDIHGGSVPVDDLKAAQALEEKHRGGGSQQATAEDVDDPEEGDISSVATGPRPTARATQQRQLANLFDDPSFAGSGASPQSSQQQGQGNEDPMVQMMRSMLGQMPDPNNPNAPPGGGGGPGQEDPMMKMLEALTGGGAGNPFQDPAAETAASDRAYLWRLVHAVSAFVMALYIALGSTFNGSKVTRRPAGVTRVDIDADADAESGVTPRLFWMFATAQLVLQSSRYFLEKGQLSNQGMLGTISRLLPEPFAGYVRMVGRYFVIWSTVVSDAMVVVFVLGAMAWWKGAVP